MSKRLFSVVTLVVASMVLSGCTPAQQNYASTLGWIALVAVVGAVVMLFIGGSPLGALAIGGLVLLIYGIFGGLYLLTPTAPPSYTAPTGDVIIVKGDQWTISGSSYTSDTLPAGLALGDMNVPTSLDGKPLACRFEGLELHCSYAP